MVTEALPLSALVPSLLLAWLLAAWSRDVRFVGTLWTAFVLGMVACIPMLFLARPAAELLGRIEDPYLLALGQAFFLAALPEELLKLAVLAALLALGAKLREPMHGLLFGGAASLGFASLENVLFASRSGLSTAMLRLVTAVPCHAVLGVVMGYFVSRAVLHRRNPRRAWAEALLVPVLLHGLYDFPLFLIAGGGAPGDPLPGGVRWAASLLVMVVLTGGAALALDMIYAAARQRPRTRPGEGLHALVAHPERVRAWGLVLVGGVLTSLGSWAILGLVHASGDLESPLARSRVFWTTLFAASAFLAVGLTGFRTGLARLRRHVDPRNGTRRPRSPSPAR